MLLESSVRNRVAKFALTMIQLNNSLLKRIHGLRNFQFSHGLAQAIYFALQTSNESISPEKVVYSDFRKAEGHC